MFDRIKYYIVFLKGSGLQLHAYKCMLTADVSSYRKSNLSLNLFSKSDWSSLMFRDGTERLR